MLYQEVRPSTFKDVFGNRAVVDSLVKIVSEKPSKRPHAFLFHGPTGCGKTTLARILAKEFGCDGISLAEMNAANTRGIDTVRDIADSAQSAPMFGDAKCYLIDESHQLTAAAQQALLKVIEDCPPHVYFMFCTTDPSKIIPTIKNRCAKYQVTPLRPSELRKLILTVAEDQKIDVSDDAVQALAKAAEGCPRQAIMLLEQIQDIENPEDVLEFISAAETASKEVIELVREVVSKRSNRWEAIVKMFPNVNADPETIRLAILGYLKKMLLGSKDVLEAGRCAELIAVFEKPTYSGGVAALLRMVFESTLVE